MEYRRKCTVCGKIYCYTDSDVFDNNADKVTAALSGIATVAQLFGGTMLGAYAMSSQRDRYDQRIKDFTQCPYCNSHSTVELSESQWLSEQKLLGGTDSSIQVPQSAKPHIEINANATTESLLKRVHLFLEDSEWDTADAYCDRILDVEPENSLAYLGKLMAETHSNNLDGLSRYDKDFEQSGNYKKALRFANDSLKSELEELVRQRDYSRAMTAMATASNASDYFSAARKFRLVPGYLDADARAEECSKKATDIQNAARYDTATKLQSHASIPDIEEAIRIFELLGKWEDSKERIDACHAKIEELKRKEEDARKQAEKKKKTITVAAISAAAFVVIAVAAFFVITKVVIPFVHYKQAETLQAAGDYDGAIRAFQILGEYKDSQNRVVEVKRQAEYRKAEMMLAEGNYRGAISAFQSPSLKNYNNSSERAKEATYEGAESALIEKDYVEAFSLFQRFPEYLNSAERAKQCAYEGAKEAFSKGEYVTAINWLKEIPGYQDENLLMQIYQQEAYNEAMNYYESEEYEDALYLFKNLTDYLDANDYSSYLLIKLIDYYNGRTYDLASIYEQIMCIKNTDLRDELLRTPQMLTLLGLDGTWYQNTKVAFEFDKGTLRGSTMDGRTLLCVKGFYYIWYSDAKHYEALNHIAEDSFELVHVFDEVISKETKININHYTRN